MKQKHSKSLAEIIRFRKEIWIFVLFFLLFFTIIIMGSFAIERTFFNLIPILFFSSLSTIFISNALYRVWPSLEFIFKFDRKELFISVFFFMIRWTIFLSIFAIINQYISFQKSELYTVKVENWYNKTSRSKYGSNSSNVAGFKHNGYYNTVAFNKYNLDELKTIENITIETTIGILGYEYINAWSLDTTLINKNIE